MTRITLAANNGDLGGGEIVLLAQAEALRDLGYDAAVVGPAAPGGVCDAARERGFATEALAPGRRAYLRDLRAWDASRSGALWCNGLVPGVATSGHPDRILEVHQFPRAVHRPLVRLARRGALATIAPSHALARTIPGARVLWNWTPPVDRTRPAASPGVTTLGFIGRITLEKGVGDLAQALALLDAEAPGEYRLVLAGEERFMGKADRARLADALRPVERLITRVGWSNPADFFSLVDLAVFPSASLESFGLVIAEAMSARAPFVITDTGAFTEIAGPGHPWVARAGAPENLAATIAAAAHADASQSASVLDRGYRRWRDEFSPTAGRDRLVALLSDVGLPARGDL